MSSIDLLYVLSHGFAARMVLQSTLLGQLRERGVSVAVLAPNADESHFRRLCNRWGVRAFKAPQVGGRGLGAYSAARRYLFEDYEKNAALRSKHLWEVGHESSHPLLRAQATLGKAVNSILLRTPRLRDVLSRVERSTLRSPELSRLLAELGPRMLVSTYPVAWLEALAIIEARRLGITTMGQLLSWDNITCKGRFAGVPDKFISWGPIMSSELSEFYGAGADRVTETGVAHFDLHRQPVDAEILGQHLRALGLDPLQPYLFFGMSAGFFAPKEVEIVAWLARLVASGTLGANLQLLVRPHPQNIRGPMSDPAVIAKLRALTHSRVALDLPGVVSDGLDMDESDLPRLAALLHGAAVTLNSGSTLTIDAMIHDRPVILTLFDADSELPWWQSARRLGEFPHLEKLLSYGGATVARSFVDLEASLRAYLDDPAKNREARRRAVRAECGPPDGRACDRIADGLASALRSI